MTKKFFHNLNSLKVSYILISGQATVLYGAATFSEDIDLWVEPKSDNWDSVINELKDLKQDNQLLPVGSKPPYSTAD